MTPPDSRTAGRFWARVDKSRDGCWLWTGSRSQEGYGYFTYSDRRGYAHRFAYELLVGPIPDGLVIDHLCRIPGCVNPAHMEPVTRRENQRRGIKGDLTTHCPSGHAYDEENTLWVKNRPRGRICRTCRDRRNKARYQ